MRPRSRTRHLVKAYALTIAALFAGMMAFASMAAGATPQIGQPAPEFTATDSKGHSLTLSQYRGKTVVLEWTNADCPYTRKHYSQRQHARHPGAGAKERRDLAERDFLGAGQAGLCQWTRR